MSLDLFQREIGERMATMPGVTEPEAGAFEGFLRGTGMGVMRSFAAAGRTASMVVASPIAALDRIDGTRLADRYFKWHDEIFGNAVDAWTPKPNEVGVAGQVVGQVLGTLPLILASPASAVATTQMGTAEDLVRKGVDPAQAIGVGTVQGVGLGLGVWMPILGQNGWQRIVLGGAGFNALQGIATRGISGGILHGTVAEKDYQAFDGEALTLDVLLGMLFGSIAHLSPAQRAQGEKTWTTLRDWAMDLKPSEKDAVAVLRQAQHLNVDSVGGKPTELVDIERHVTRTRTALEQLGRDEPVQVEDLPAPKVEADPARWVEAEKRVEQLKKEGDRIAKQYDLALEEPRQRTEGPAGQPDAAEPPPPRGGEPGKPTGPEAEQINPVTRAADQIVADEPDRLITVGSDAEGKPTTMTAKEYLATHREAAARAREDASLFEIAAQCLLGGA